MRPLPDVVPDNLWQTDTEACCHIRKVEPLQRSMDGKAAWVTGVRRVDGPTRANAPVVTYDIGRNIAKINPLATWTDDDMALYAQLNDLPANPLSERGYPSIGCWPCTRPVAPGEDKRAGRWSGSNKTECGLHVSEHRLRLADVQRRHLEDLADEAVTIIREVATECENPVLLFSGGKDSAVLLHLAVLAFAPARLPFPVMHVDTGHNFPEVIEYRDEFVERIGARLVIASVQASIDAGRVVEDEGPRASRNRLQSVTLLDAIAEHGFDAAFGGGRRDEDKARAKERILSFRDRFGRWDPRAQRPEPWDLLNARIRKGEHLRAFPLSNWTELDIWQFIKAEEIPLPSIYFSHRRTVVPRDGMLLSVGGPVVLEPGEEAFEETVRYRTVGDASCTGAVRSDATTIDQVIAEVATARITERGATRADDTFSESAMEDRKREGYF